MSLAVLCAGQGSERPEMGSELASAHPEAARLLDLASELVDLDVPRLLRRGGAALGRTEVMQPVLTAVALGAAAAIGDQLGRAIAGAGHSVGEVAAAAIAGWLEPDDALALARTRGVLMARQAAARRGKMLAIFADRPERALELGRAVGEVALAAHNQPSEWVLSGEPAALSAVAASERARWLEVSGAWHSPAMAGAVAPFRAALDGALRPRPSRDILLIGNRDGSPLSDREAVIDGLAGQLVRPVDLVGVFRALDRRGAGDIVILGPASPLRGLVRRTLGARRPKIFGTDDLEDIRRLREALR